MARAVGPQLAGASPVWASVGKLQELVESQSLATVAAACRDERMTRETWEAVFRGEITSLLIWILKRAQHALVMPDATATPVPYVLSLLPSYGCALHLVRRAAPFALLGVPTLVSGPPGLLEMERAVNVIREELALGDKLVIAHCNSEEMVKLAAREQAPIVFTGRRSTFDEIVTKHPSCQIFGATGTHSLVLGSSRKSVMEIVERKRSEGLNRSCSNVGAWAVVDPDSGVLYDRASERADASFDVTLVELIERDQPTVVFVDEGAHRLVGNAIAGYKVIRYHEGTTDSAIGFGRDPVCGWCGDYTF